MCGVSVIPVAPVKQTRLACCAVECWNAQNLLRFSTINVRFVHAPTDDCCVWIGCVDAISDDTPTETRPLSFDPWWKNRVECPRRGYKIDLAYNPSTVLPDRSYIQLIKFVVFRYWKLRFRCTCHHTVFRSCLGALIWKTVVTRPRAYRVGPIGHATSSGVVLTRVWGSIALNVSTFYPESYPNFHIKIPTHLGPGYASEISHLKA